MSNHIHLGFLNNSHTLDIEKSLVCVGILKVDLYLQGNLEDYISPEDITYMPIERLITRQPQPFVTPDKALYLCEKSTSRYVSVVRDFILNDVIPALAKHKTNIVKTKQVISKIETPETMSSLDIAKLTGKQHKHILSDIKNMLEQLNIHSAEFSAQYKDSTGRTLPCFNLNEELTLTLTSGYSIPQRNAIIKQWQSYRNIPQPQLTLPSNYKEALLQLVEKVEEVEHLQLEVEEAKRTKAHINDKKVATALGTAGNLAKKVKQLERQLDAITTDTDAYAAIRDVQKLISDVVIDWRKMKEYSIAHGLEIKKVDGAIFDKVKLYHAGAWMGVYGIDIKQILGVR